MTEHEIVRAAQSGDDEAFRILVERHHTRIYNLLIGMVHQADIADELTQETFVKAWRSLRGFRMRSSFWTWIYRIAYRIGVDYIRSMRGCPIALMEDAVADSWNDGPFKAVEARDLRTALWEALSALTLQQRTAIILYFFHGLSYKEIAKVMQRQLGTVRTDLHRGKQQLRIILEQRWGIDETSITQ